MIPKIIHWCWLSGDPLPDKIKACVESWSKIMPDYEIRCWTTKEFDVNSIPYVRDAYKLKKWAFCADYIRAYALYNVGGFYLDSDVQVIKRFDDILEYGFVSAVEFSPDYVELFDIETKCLDVNKDRIKQVSFILGIALQAAIMGAIKGHPYLKDCLEYYASIDFRMGKGYDNMAIVAPNIYALCAEKYGFKYKNEDQLLSNGMMIFKDEVFCVPEFVSNRTLAIHLVAHSWFEPTKMQFIYDNLSKIKTLKVIFDFLEKNMFSKRIIGWLKKSVWIN